MAHLNRDFNGVDAGSKMSKRRQKPTDAVMRSASKNKLRQQMSEVISLREKVEQAELATRDQTAEASQRTSARPHKRVSPRNGGAASPDENKGQSQSPGHPGPLTTGRGGASATNPQGGTPPNMQVAPDSSSKSGVDQK
jgi:hypothetical protein